MEYQTKAIAYIDILGFKNYIETVRGKSSIDALYRSLIEFKPSVQAHPLRYPSREASHFSDLLVISVDYNHIYINQLITDLITLTNKIIEGASLLLRGIIIKGEILHTNGIIFGPGLIDAYEKERQTVKYPRIVVEENVISELKLDTRNLYKDIDNKYYIDYLKGNIDVSSSNIYRRFGFFTSKVFINLIKTGLASTDNRIKEKYTWIINRHNQIVEDYYKINKQEVTKLYTTRIKNLEEAMKGKL